MEQIYEYEVHTNLVLFKHYLHYMLFARLCFLDSTKKEKGLESIVLMHDSISHLFLFIYVYRKSWRHVSMKNSFLFQMSGYMARLLHKLITVPHYVLSMSRMFILQILQKFLISRYTQVPIFYANIVLIVSCAIPVPLFVGIIHFVYIHHTA
jgi:hypothetical protein